MRSVIIANVLAGLCCLVMAGYGLIMLMISQLDPMEPYYAGIVLGCALATLGMGGLAWDSLGGR